MKPRKRKKHHKNQESHLPRYVYQSDQRLGGRWTDTKFSDKIEGTPILTHSLSEAKSLVRKLNHQEGFHDPTIEAEKKQLPRLEKRRITWEYDCRIRQGLSKAKAARGFKCSLPSIENWIKEDGDYVYDPRFLNPYDGEPISGYEGQLKSFKRDAGRNGKTNAQMGWESFRPRKFLVFERYRLLIEAEWKVIEEGLSLNKSLEQVASDNGIPHSTMVDIHNKYRVHERGTVSPGWEILKDEQYMKKWILKRVKDPNVKTGRGWKRHSGKYW